MIITYLLHSGVVAGGVRIICEHCNRLAQKGHEIYISLITNMYKLDWFKFSSNNVHIINFVDSKEIFNISDAIISTFWSTAYDLNKIQTNAKKYYFIQQRESNFYNKDNEKQIVEKTYDLPLNMITISPWLQKFLDKDHNKNSHLVRNGLDFDLFFPEPILPKNKYTVLVEGSGTNIWKSNYIVYEALKGLDIDIWSLSIENETRSNKHFCNPKQDMIRKIYSSADVVVKPSLSEGLSAIPAESLICGCNIIATDIPGINDYVIDGYNGLLVPINNKQAIRKAVINLMEDKELSNKLKINGFKTVNERFQWQDKIDLLEDIYSSTNKLKSAW